MPKVNLKITGIDAVKRAFLFPRKHGKTQHYKTVFNSDLKRLFRVILMSDEYAKLFFDKQDQLLSVSQKALELQDRMRTLEIALAESLKLQSHYARLLNQYDGGEHMVFDSPEQWIARLKEIGELREEE
jgi:hypothetical protein